MKTYKSPAAALLWSIVMTGFGQLYNGQYIFGGLLFSVELITNGCSNLNSAIMLSFAGNMKEAHDIFDPQWGLFYPSTYIFAVWQAYNKAIIINCQQDGKDSPRETFLTGLFFGLVIGMNLGVYWQPDIINEIPYVSLIFSPIFSGLSFGMIGGLTGHLIEKYYKKSRSKR